MFDRYPMLVGMHHPPFGSDGIQSHDSAVSKTMCERYCWIIALLRDLATVTNESRRWGFIHAYWVPPKGP